jgi:hypothetical protein
LLNQIIGRSLSSPLADTDYSSPSVQPRKTHNLSAFSVDLKICVFDSVIAQFSFSNNVFHRTNIGEAGRRYVQTVWWANGYWHTMLLQKWQTAIDILRMSASRWLAMGNLIHVPQLARLEQWH